MAGFVANLEVRAFKQTAGDTIMSQDPPKFTITREGQHFRCPNGEDLLELVERVHGIAGVQIIPSENLFNYSVELSW